MTFAEALSNTGGILGFVYVAFHIFIMKFQEFIFQRDILEKIFYYEKQENSNNKKRKDNSV
jgi:hypothetical protein